jgi:hypothetical protein
VSNSGGSGSWYTAGGGGGGPGGGSGPGGGGGGGASSYGKNVFARGGGGAGSCGNSACPMCYPQVPGRTASGPGGASGTVQAPPAPAGNYGPGLDGFNGQLRQDFDLAIGTVTGYRWWRLPAPDFSQDPLDADQHWPADRLTGQCGWVYPAGVSEAICLNQQSHNVPTDYDPHTGLVCGCGFWAYWQPQDYHVQRGGLPIFGVIEGFGRTLIGTAGFRSQKARVVALIPSLRLVPESTYSGWYDPLAGRPGDQIDDARIETWMAVLETRLEQLYPGVRVFSTLSALRAAYPPTPGYTPEEPPFPGRP